MGWSAQAARAAPCMGRMGLDARMGPRMGRDLHQGARHHPVYSPFL